MNSSLVKGSDELERSLEQVLQLRQKKPAHTLRESMHTSNRSAEKVAASQRLELDKITDDEIDLP